MPDDNEQNEQSTDDQTELSFWQVLGSTLAAAFGVQSSKNRERDFSQGKASHFIVMGIAVTLIFVVIVVGVVSMVLP